MHNIAKKNKKNNLYVSEFLNSNVPTNRSEIEGAYTIAQHKVDQLQQNMMIESYQI